jgi:putative peptidoglycan lipid II flippase
MDTGVDVVGRHRGLVLRTAIVSLLTLASRLLGFVRETLAAALFGDASPVNDAFVTAWRVPNLFRSLLGEGAMATSLQTALTREDGERGLAAGRRLFWALARIVGLSALVLCALVMLAAWFLPDTLPFTDWAWLGADPAPVRELVVRLMPFVVFVCLAAVVGGALQVRGHFASTALAPVLMNLWWIAALGLAIAEFGFDPRAEPAGEFARQMGIARALGWYVLVAGAILLAVQLPALRSLGFLGGALPPAGADEPRLLRARVWRVLREAAPLALGAAVYQVNVMIDGFMAEGLLPNGGPTVLYYATRVQQLPMSLVAAAATAAVFPALAALGQGRREAELRALHDETHLAIVFVALPAALGLFFFAQPIMAVCFEHGAFGAQGTERGAAVLRALSLAVLPAGAAGLVARTLYALGDLRTPVRISIGVLVLNVGLNFALVLGLRMDADGLALSTGLCAWLNLALLLPALRRRLGPSAQPRELRGRLVRLALAAAIAVGASRLIWAFLASRCGRTVALLSCIALALGAYALCCQLLRVPEWQATLSRARRRSPAGSAAAGRRN